MRETNVIARNIALSPCLMLAAPLAAHSQQPASAGTGVLAHVSSPKPADELLATARASAAKHHKVTLVMFHASWCGWCKRLDAVMSRPEFKKMFESNYAIVTLDVLENGPKVAELENPGGRELMKSLGGEKSGLPFYAWLDADGKKIADSNAMPKEQNIGYPGEPDEIEAFMALIQKTAPNWPEADRTRLHDYLVANRPKPAAAH